MLDEQSTFEVFLDAAKGKRVIGFGAGRHIPNVIDVLSEHNMSLDYIVDNDIWKWGRQHCGVSVQSPAKLQAEQFEDIVVLICNEYLFDIEKQLRDMGINQYYGFCLWISLMYKRTGNIPSYFFQYVFRNLSRN